MGRANSSSCCSCLQNVEMDSTAIFWTTCAASLTVWLVVREAFYRAMAPRRFNPKGKHCYITGGSMGLGKALAIELIKRGAHVTIVARTKATLQQAAGDIKKHRREESQKVNWFSADIADEAASEKALLDAKAAVGKAPEYVFCCAGMARPGLMLDLKASDYIQHMNINYNGTVFTVKKAVELMVDEGVKGKIMLVSSIAGLLSFVGYSPYSPTKGALRFLGEALRSELLGYGIDVHVYFPGTIDSPGLVEENKTKPKLTKLIEGDDKSSPEHCVAAMIHGLERGYFMITSDFIGHVARAASACAMSWNNVVVDFGLFVLSLVIMPVFRTYADVLVVLDHRKAKGN